jgi:hypothetical protein
MAEEFRYVTTNLYQTPKSLNPSVSQANPIIAELPFTGVVYTNQLNSIGTFNGHLLLSGSNSYIYNSYEGTIPGKTILWVLYSNADNGVSVPVWSGVIWGREYDASNQTLSITAQEMMSLFNRRLITTTRDYTNNPSDPLGYDPSYIAQNLLDLDENRLHGDVGLNTTLFVNPTAYRTKQKYESFQYKPVYQAIKDLSANFFDFKIAPGIAQGNLVNYFHLDDPLGVTYSASDPYALVFSYPGNLVDYKYPEDGSSAANRLYGFGYGTGTVQYQAIAQDDSKLGTYTVTGATRNGVTATYTTNPNHAFLVGQTVIVYSSTVTSFNGSFTVLSITSNTFTVANSTSSTFSGSAVAVGDWPLLEQTAQFTDIGQLQLLKDLTVGQLDSISYPPTTIQIIIPTYIDPVYTSYNVGDQIRLNIKDDYFPSGLYNEVLRIIAISVEPGENGPSRVTLTLTRQLAAGVVS